MRSPAVPTLPPISHDSSAASSLISTRVLVPQRRRERPESERSGHATALAMRERAHALSATAQRLQRACITAQNHLANTHVQIQDAIAALERAMLALERSKR